MDQVQFLECDTNSRGRVRTLISCPPASVPWSGRLMKAQSAGPCSRNTSSCSSPLIIARAGRVCRMISSSPIWDWLSSCVPAFSVCSTTPDTVRSCDPSCVVLRVSDPRRCSESTSTRSQRLHLYAVQAIYHACRNLIYMPS